MAREWKPGDVAIRRGLDGEQRTIVASRECADRNHDAGPHWHHCDGGWDPLTPRGPHVSYRPLVVIDAEDAEQVEALSGRIMAAECGDGMAPRDAVQAALRSLANPTPPKPEEPMGLGAVVEDDKGEFWIRTTTDPEEHYGKPWQLGGTHKHWQIVAAVKVLSEGVTA